MMNFGKRTGRLTVSGLVAASVAFTASAGFAAPAATPTAATSTATTSTSTAPHYDGLWSVSIVTEKGACDRGYRYPIRITNGTVLNAGDTVVTITGKVAPAGTVTVKVSHGGSSATGSGRLAGGIGEGSWSGGDCSGTWTAERRGS